MGSDVRTTAAWGALGLLAGAAVATAVLLPLYPEDPVGYEEVGWILAAIALGVLLSVLGGVVAVHRALRRAGASHVWWTLAVLVVLAVALASVTAGAGALAAPGLARWLVEAVARRRACEPAVSGISRG